MEVKTAKDKAKELVSRFKEFVRKMDFSIEDAEWIHSNSVGEENAKQCALILCDEVINGNGAGIEFWKEVKSEIEKLVMVKLIG